MVGERKTGLRRLGEALREKRPDRWSGATRTWAPVTTVRLNPTKGDLVDPARDAA